MASITQTTNTFNDLGSVNQAGWLSAFSVTALSKIDFKYIWTISNSSGDLYEDFTLPSHTGHGYFNVYDIFNDYFDIDLSIGTISQDKEFATEYTVTVAEYYDGGIQVAGVATDILLGGNNKYNVGASKLPYDITSFQNKLISDRAGVIKMSDSSVGSIIMPPNGTFNSFIRIYYRVKGIYDGVQRDLLWTSGAFNITHYDYQTNVYNDTAVFNKMPMGYGQLKTQSIWLQGEWNGTTVVPINDLRTGIEDGWTTVIPQSMEVFASQSVTIPWEDPNVSQILKFNIESCGRTDATVLWEGVSGGIEFFDFTALRDDNIKNTIVSYEHAPYEFDNGVITSDVNETVVDQNITYAINLRTPYLQLDDIEYLKSLFVASNIILNIDGEEYEVLPINEDHIVHNKYLKQVYYTISFKYKKKI